MRPILRSPDQIARIAFEPGFTRHAEGSCLFSFGDNPLAVTASVEDRCRFLRGKAMAGSPAEYAAAARAPPPRNARRPGRHLADPGKPALSALVARVVDFPNRYANYRRL